MKCQSRQELVTYALVWLFLFASPVVSHWAHSLSEPGIPYDWDNVLRSWQLLGLFAVTFAVHNFMIAPVLIYRHRRWLYLACVVVLVSVFMGYHCTYHNSPRDNMEIAPPPPPPADAAGHRPQPPVERHDMLAMAMLMMMLGANLGAKLYFKTEQDRHRLVELERLNLEQELQYLRYQVNPHFLMNTLNNIHALVDIDRDKAKTCIIELSRLLRYMLYEGNKPSIPLRHEVDFIKHYFDLMRIRFSDRVRITVNLDNPLPTVDVPPMLGIPFVENAFKHGVSYVNPSFIDVAITSRDDRLIFTCVNSKQSERHEHGGVGLANVTKRLDLIYGSDYSLAIDDRPEQYSVTLNVPITQKTPL